jgi:hypothetical protein
MSSKEKTLVPAELFTIPSNIEQTPQKLICTIERFQVVIMEQQRLWRFEVNNPLISTEWQPLWEVDEEDQLVASQELRDELNKINAPVQLRIVRSSH